MKLNEEQISQIKKILAEGASISDVQKYISENFSLSMTFMDTRFLLDDLDLEIKKEEKLAENKGDDSLDLNKQEEPQAMQGVQVELSPIQELGTLASGTARFSDGVSVKWFVDESGQIGITGAPQGYAPSQEDAMQFQDTLRNMLQNRL